MFNVVGLAIEFTLWNKFAIIKIKFYNIVDYYLIYNQRSHESLPLGE
jgi:hypothetical protein